MALPALINNNGLLGSASPATIDNQMRTLAGAIVDIFGLPNNTNISAALMNVAAGGLQYVVFQNVGGSPGAAGRLQRNATNLEFHDGTAARILYQQSGQDVAVADGGTALSTAPSNGQLLIGNGTGYTLAVPTAGTNMDSIATGAGTLTFNATSAPVGKATITGNITTNSATMVDATGLTVTITPGVRRVLLALNCRMSNSDAAGTITYFEFLVDGVSEGTDMFEDRVVVGGIGGVSREFVWLTEAQTSGSHTYKVQWRTTAGTSTISAAAGTPASFTAIAIL